MSFRAAELGRNFKIWYDIVTIFASLYSRSLITIGCEMKKF